MIHEITDLHYTSRMFIMICINLVSPTGLYHYGIVYQITFTLCSEKNTHLCFRL